jgi:RNA polymerase sigma-70 factor (ECF subfamily)
MSDSLPPPDDLIRRLRDGSSSAAAEVVSEFTRRMLALARSRFDDALRPKEDPEDVVQSAFKSFFRGCSDGKFSLAGKEELWGLLALITLRKCRQHRRYFGTARRQIRREVSEQRAEHAPVAATAGREPPPDEHLLLAETVQQLFANLDGQHQAILMLGLDGHETSDIAQQVGCTERTVQRVLQRARHRLEQWAKDADAPATES